MTKDMFLKIEKLKNKMEEYERFLRIISQKNVIISVSGNVSNLKLPPHHEDARIDLGEDTELADLLLKQMIFRLENIKHEFDEI